MKKLLVIGLAALLFTACKQEVRYTQTSPEIDHVKAAQADYLEGDWESYMSHYAPDAKIFHNATESNPKTPEQIVEVWKALLAGVSSYSFLDDQDAIEMVIDDDGETWVNYWGVWKGTYSDMNQTFEIPIHITCQFINGKIVKEYGYWDDSPVVKARMTFEAAQKAAADSTAIKPVN